MPQQGQYPLNGRTPQLTDTATGVVGGATADIPLSAIVALAGGGGGGSVPTLIAAAINALLAQLAAPTGGSLIGYQSSFTGAVPRTDLARGRDIVSIFDAVTGAVLGATINANAAFALVDGLGMEVFLPPATYVFNANATLRGAYYFAAGAIIKIAAGVTVTLNNAIFKIADYQVAFDLSLGGKLAGKLFNQYSSACWFKGVDPTGATVSGAAAQLGHDQQICKRYIFPYGLYNMTGTAFVEAGVVVSGPQGACVQATDYATLFWAADLGAGKNAWTIADSTYDSRAVNTALKGIALSGPNAGARGYTPGCQMDGLMIGGAGGGQQCDVEEVFVSNFRFNLTGWTSGGHCTFTRFVSNGGFAAINFVFTGGDYKFLNCAATGYQLAAIYLAKNGDPGVHLMFKIFYYGYGPYGIRQVTTLDSRNTSTSTSAIVGALFEIFESEQLGNAAVWMEPTDSAISISRHQDFTWDMFPGNLNYAITTDPQDYPYKLGYYNHLTFGYGRDGGGLGLMSPGTAGVFQYVQAFDALVSGFQTTQSALPYVSGPNGGNFGMFIPASYTASQFTIAGGNSTYTYTMTNEEKYSTRRMVPQAIQLSGAPVASVASINSAAGTVTITLASAVPDGSNYQFAMSLLPSATSIY